MLSANKLYKQSGSTLPFKDWLEREKNKGKFIPNVEAMEKFYNADGSETTTTNDNEISKADYENNQVTNRLIKTALIVALGYFVYKTWKK
jgi:hypothetical protein